MAVDCGLIPAPDPIKAQSHVLALKGQADWDKSACPFSIVDISGKEAFDAGWFMGAKSLKSTRRESWQALLGRDFRPAIAISHSNSSERLRAMVKVLSAKQ